MRGQIEELYDEYLALLEKGMDREQALDEMDYMRDNVRSRLVKYIAHQELLDAVAKESV